ncbi:hypothetical protein Scep_002151 [Stephania cephalantha]|uniref:Uncharacterized protein n=1 Tax=Stephania cephalantha TaxID=152367 RepID=A0AAP0Q4E4_9MAGN
MRRQYIEDRARYHEALLRYELDRQRRIQDRLNGRRSFMLFLDHHRDIARYERSRMLRPTDRFITFLAAMNYSFDPDLVQNRRVEHPLTSSYVGAYNNDANDDAQS